MQATGTTMIMKTTKIRTYKDLIRIVDYRERFEYLRLQGEVGEITFGWERFINQALYRSAKWRKIRDKVIVRDNGCDLAHPDYEIRDRIIIHHMNPITLEDIEEENEFVYSLDFLVCVSPITHNAIHYGDASLLPSLPIARYPGDTCPWK